MSDERPLRQEEYRAMAEENRRLTAELVALKDKEEKVRDRRSFAWKSAAGWVSAAVVVLSVVSGIGIWFYRDIVDVREQRASVACYKVDQVSTAMRPWDPYHVWEMRASRRERMWEVHVDGFSFKNREEALAFLRGWGVRVCP